MQQNLARVGIKISDKGGHDKADENRCAEPARGLLRDAVAVELPFAAMRGSLPAMSTPVETAPKELPPLPRAATGRRRAL